MDQADIDGKSLASHQPFFYATSANLSVYLMDKYWANSHDYQKILRQHGFRTSMSGKGNFYDNAAVETFFKTIKAELIWRDRWSTRRQAEMAVFEYINGFYNPRRRHSALGWKSPVAFERKVA